MNDYTLVDKDRRYWQDECVKRDARVAELEEAIMREAARRLRAMSWRPITDQDPAPNDELHVRGMYVNVTPRAGNPYRYWYTFCGVVEAPYFVDLNGDDCGYPEDEFTHWTPLPQPPEPTDG